MRGEGGGCIKVIVRVQCGREEMVNRVWLVKENMGCKLCELGDTRVKKRISERVSPTVMHIIRFETLTENLVALSTGCTEGALGCISFSNAFHW